MMRYVFVLLCLPFSFTACAEEPESAPPEPDPAVIAQLEELGYVYETEENGDFRLLFDLDEERSQLAWIRNRTYQQDGVMMRDIWSTAFKLPGKYVSIKLADRLLRDSWNSVMGSWAREGNYVVYIVKLPVDATAEKLDAAIGEVIDAADGLERERSYEDDY